MITSTRRHQDGVGLIEVMVALLILAIGLLGVAALQAVTLKNVGSSSERTQAMIQAYSALDTMRLQKKSAAAGTMNTTSGGYQCSTATALGAPGTVAGWLADLRMTIGPSACGKVNCSVDSSGNTVCDVGVRWNDERATGGSTQEEVKASTRL
ncbi:type IV pilus modification protein PilV [Thermomonas sp.]